MNNDKIYEITMCPVSVGYNIIRTGHGLCNQVCMLLNTIDYAFQIVSLGNNIILKDNVQSAEYGGANVDISSLQGNHIVNHVALLNGHDPTPGQVKELKITWKKRWKANIPAPTTYYKENTYITWLDFIPDTIHIFVDKFLTHYLSSELIPLNEVLNFVEMNDILRHFSIKIIYKEYNEQTSPNICSFIPDINSPKSSLLFKNLLSILRFQPSFYKKIDDWAQDKQIHNVIHVRNENDAIYHWATRNNMTEQAYERKIKEVYQHHIQTHIDKNKLTIILTGHTENNSVIEWMREEGYNFSLLPKLETRRELCAIYDLIIALKCQDVFIGASNIKRINGSTFSFFINRLLPNNVLKVMIDIENIN